MHIYKKYTTFAYVLIVLSYSIQGYALSTMAETLEDPILEARAQHLESRIRCPVCASQTIDSSDSTMALAMRQYIRVSLLKNKTDATIIEHLHQAYGDSILITPPVSTKTIVLWLLPLLGFMIGGILWWRVAIKSTSQ
jgi:cytochrome c-type biogenesis protein CcmH